MSQLFTPYALGPLTLPNRIVIAPMCQYSAEDGNATDWHLMHWANLLNSGAGMFTIEATGVLPEGRITPAKAVGALMSREAKAETAGARIQTPFE